MNPPISNPRRVSLLLDRDDWDELAREAAEERGGAPVSALIREIVRRHLRQKKGRRAATLGPTTRGDDDSTRDAT